MINQIKDILLEIKPDLDLECKELVSLGELDSFDIVMLVQKLEDSFDIRIPVSKILLENFNSAEDISNMITSLKNGNNT